MTDQNDPGWNTKAFIEALKGDGHSHEYVPGVYHVSELPFCARKSWFHRKLGTKSIVNGKMLRGTLFHSKLIEIMPDIVKEEVSFEGEVECDDALGWKILGHYDMDDGVRVWEFKFTEHSIDNTTDLPIYYMLQANTYAILMKRKGYRIVLVNPDKLTIQSFDYETNSEAFNAICRKADYIHKNIKADTIPEGPVEKWECTNRSSTCQFFSVCKNLGTRFLEPGGKERSKTLELTV